MIQFFSFIGVPLGWLMYQIFSIVGNYGVTLIIFSIFIKLLMIPLGIRQQKGLITNARMQPKMRELQRMYANNKQKYSEELQKLYNKEGFSALSSCLPLLIQFPILFGMLDVIYYPIKHMIKLPADVIDKAIVLATSVLGEAGMNAYSKEISVLQAIKLDPGAFAGLGSEYVGKLTSFDFTMFGLFLGDQPSLTPGGMPVGTWVALLMIPVLSGLSSLVMSLVTSKSTAASADGQMAGMNNTMLLMMPLMSVWISFIVPAGVGIYWLISNILSSIQSVILNKIMNPAEAIRRAEEEERLQQETERQERIEAKKQMREQRALEQREEATLSGGRKGEKKQKDPESYEELPVDEPGLSQKEQNRRKLAAARRRDAQRYGELFSDAAEGDVKAQ